MYVEIVVLHIPTTARLLCMHYREVAMGCLELAYSPDSLIAIIDNLGVKQSTQHRLVYFFRFNVLYARRNYELALSVCPSVRPQLLVNAIS